MPEYDADILTGAERSTNSRPVAVMVNNIANSQRQNARPQRGIGSADLLIEAKVEGGITRLCAVFSDADSIPEVGPIRSGRDQFLQLLMPWNILYYHDGESIFCTQFVNVYGYSGLNIGGKSYFNTPTHPHVAHRDSRGRNVAYEHTEFTSGAEIRKAAANAGIGLQYPYESTFFRFADYRTGAENKMSGAAAAKTSLERNALVDEDLQPLRLLADAGIERLGGLPRKIFPVLRQTAGDKLRFGIFVRVRRKDLAVAVDLPALAADRDVHIVVQGNGLHNGAEIMIAVLALIQNVQR